MNYYIVFLKLIIGIIRNVQRLIYIISRQYKSAWSKEGVWSISFLVIRLKSEIQFKVILYFKIDFYYIQLNLKQINIY